MTALSLRGIPVTRRASALYCAIYGSGSPLLLIHDFGATGAALQPLVPALAAAHQVIVPDLRGHGNSRRLPIADSIERFALDLTDLCDLLGSAPAVVVGHGAGAAVAMQLARTTPQAVRGLLLIGPRAYGDAHARPNLPGRVRALFGRRGAEAGAHAVEASDSLIQRFDSRPWLGTLRQPALLFAGAADTLAPPSHVREIARLLPNAEVAVFSGAGRALPQTHAPALIDHMLPWLARHAA
jgi:3-oxoadipate enol-lactonase